MPFSPSTRIAAMATCAVALSATAVALAAPNREATLSASVVKFDYDGGPVSGALFDVTVDDTLIKLDAPGALGVKITEFSNPDVNDLDMALYKSDASGEPIGDPLVEGQEIGEENVSVKGLSAGFYLINVYAFTGVEATFKGSATLTPSGGAPAPSTDPAPGETPAPGGGPAPGATPAPSGGAASTDLPPVAKIGKLAKSARVKKVKTFSGTASDDKAVKAVTIALVLQKGKRCTQMKSNGKFAKLKKCVAPSSFVKARGTTRWSYKLKRRLAKGKYTLFARAIDSAGQKQGGFSKSNKKSFKVK